MKTLETKRNDSARPQERFSRRTQNGVEILEHETTQVIKMNGDRYETVHPAPPAPRLVISDAPSATKLLIAKTRSDIAGLNAFLRAITNPPMKAK